MEFGRTGEQSLIVSFCSWARSGPSHRLSMFCQVETPQPEIWADYGSYDWVAVCQLFGKMIYLPDGMPMYINDIQQEARRLGMSENGLPEQETGAHNALEDAEHVQVLWQLFST